MEVPVNIKKAVQKRPKEILYFRVLIEREDILAVSFFDCARAIVGRSILETAPEMVVGKSINGMDIAVKMP